MLPELSVIMPVRDAAGTIEAALRSALAQDADLEVLVVDDGSRDDSAARAARFGPRVRVLRQARAGPSAARNRGIAAARAEVIGFLDADDLYAPGALAPLLACLREASAPVLHARLQDLGPGAALGPPRHSFNLGSLLCARTVFARAGVLDEALHYSEDVDFLVRLRDEGVARRLDSRVLLHYRRHEGSLVGRLTPEERRARHVDKWFGILRASLARKQDP